MERTMSDIVRCPNCSATDHVRCCYRCNTVLINMDSWFCSTNCPGYNSLHKVKAIEPDSRDIEIDQFQRVIEARDRALRLSEIRPESHRVSTFARRIAEQSPRIRCVELVKYEFKGMIDIPRAMAILAKAHANNVVMQFYGTKDVWEDRSWLWFNGRPGKALDDVRTKIVKLVRVWSTKNGWMRVT